MVQIDFNNELNKLRNRIGKKFIGALATSVNNEPTVRNMSFIIYNNKLYFQTGTDLHKYTQISENKNVAICYENIQMEGEATIIGQTNKNNEIMDEYKQLYEKSYNTYSRLEKEVLIEIRLKKIIIWEYDTEGNPYRIFIEIETGKAYKINYDLKRRN
jgi:general stress protein 26